MAKNAGGMTPEQFVAKWKPVELPERAASQEHFLDLCRLLGQPTPAETDPTGQDYRFEKPVKVVGAASKGSKGDYGFVDVWKRGRFAWEYKTKDKHKNLDDAYRHVYQYRDALDDPRLTVVCDIRTIEIYARPVETSKQVAVDLVKAFVVSLTSQMRELQRMPKRRARCGRHWLLC